MRATSSWAVVDPEVLSANVRSLQAAADTAVMAVVKANGYGHGAVEVACAALRGGATWLGVAQVDEAIALVDAGFDAPILVLGWTPPGRYIEAVTAGIRLTIWSSEHVAGLAEAAARAGRTAVVHVKVDTGMSRLGATPEQTGALLSAVAAVEGVEAEGVFTHYAVADDPHHPSVAAQSKLFEELVHLLQSQELRPPVVHAANSAAALALSQTRWDLVRFGIAMYGLSPGEGVRLPDDVRPALTWRTRLAQVKQVAAGTGVSYGHTHLAPSSERIGTVPVGYADGFRRVAGNRVLVGGVEVPVVGRVCMDQIMVLLDDVPGAEVGDEVVLIGSQGEASRTADDVAKTWGTIGYEVVCGIGARTARRYECH